MIRRSTAIWLLLAGLVGFSVFQLKHEVQTLDDEIGKLNRAILVEQQAIHVLRAEWSYLSQPTMLMEMTRRHLDLQPMQPDQLARLSDLPRRPLPGQPDAGAATPKPPAPVAGRPQAQLRPGETRPAPPANPNAPRRATSPAQADSVPVGHPRGAR